MEQQGVCPVCGKEELVYGDTVLDGNQMGYHWQCSECLSQGTEWYALDFIEHTDVIKGGKRSLKPARSKKEKPKVITLKELFATNTGLDNYHHIFVIRNRGQLVSKYYILRHHQSWLDKKVISCDYDERVSIYTVKLGYSINK